MTEPLGVKTDTTFFNELECIPNCIPSPLNDVSSSSPLSSLRFIICNREGMDLIGGEETLLNAYREAMRE